MLSVDNIKNIDLFAGTGAFSFAFEQECDSNTVFANDMYVGSEKMFNLNHTIKLTNCNLHDVDTGTIPSHNILCGGFPCQPFSIAGKQRGFKDERSNVFWKIIDILKVHKPQIIVLENVKNLCSHDSGKTFKIIIKELTKLGYNIRHKVLNTCEITDIPQNRERIYIIGFLHKPYYDKFSLDFPAVKSKQITDMLESKVPTKYYYTPRFKVFGKIKEAVTKTNTIYQYRRHYVRENKTGVCPTLTANMGSGGHNVPLIKDEIGIRKLTPRECFNFQGFPSNWKLPNISDGQLYKLSGNAVSVPVVRLIAERIFNVIDEVNDES
jgi:DNA (cytosine-5)-methyltransferase 1